MKKYVAVFTLKPAIRLSSQIGNLDMNFLEKRPKHVMISRINQKIDKCEAQIGLRFRVTIDAANAAEARSEAKGVVDGITSFMTLISGVGLGIPREELIYEITDDVPEREFIQAFYDVVGLNVSRRTLDHDVLTEIIGRCLKLEPKYSEPMSRAVRWYRMGVMASDKFDRFNCFWIGLEALNPLLQEALKVRDNPNIGTCPNCGYELVATPMISGVKAFIQTQMPDGAEVYKQARQLRVAIMHSIQTLTELIPHVERLAPKIGEILFRTILFLLKVDRWNTETYKPILEQVPTRLELHGTLFGGTPNSLGLGENDPCLEPKSLMLHCQVLEDGKITFTTESSFEAKLGPNVQLGRRGLLLHGDAEIKASIRSDVIKRTTDL